MLWLFRTFLRKEVANVVVVVLGGLVHRGVTPAVLEIEVSTSLVEKLDQGEVSATRSQHEAGAVVVVVGVRILDVVKGNLHLVPVTPAGGSKGKYTGGI